MKSIKIGKQEWNKIVRLCLVKCTDGKGFGKNNAAK